MVVAHQKIANMGKFAGHDAIELLALPCTKVAVPILHQKLRNRAPDQVETGRVKRFENAGEKPTPCCGSGREKPPVLR